MKHQFFLKIFIVMMLLTACANEKNQNNQSSVVIPTQQSIETAVITPTTSDTTVPHPEPTINQAERELGYPVSELSTPQPAEAYPAPANDDLFYEPAPQYTYTIVNNFPHDPNAFTQGLLYIDGFLYEGTGRRGQSTLRKVDLNSGEVLMIHSLADEYFGEGVTIFEDKIYQLTWQSNIGFIYDQDSFAELNTFTYPTEGWGLTHDGQQLIMSDGTNTLFFLDPETLEVVNRIFVVNEQGLPITRLNELEYIDGEILANIWQTNQIVRIDPQSGQVTGRIDLSGLLDTVTLTQPVDVLNGIAYNEENGRLFVTGKLWPTLFEIELLEETAVAYPNP